MINPMMNQELVPKVYKIKSLLAQEKARHDASVDVYQRGDLKVIEDEIARVDTEHKARQARIDALDARLSNAPPEMPERVRLSDGEAVGTLFGALMGDGARAADAASRVAERRQGIAYQNAMQKFSLDRDNDLRQYERESRISDFLRAQQGQLGMAKAEVVGNAEDQNANRQFQTAMQESQQAFEAASDVRRFAISKQLSSFEAGLQRQLEELRTRNQWKATRIEFTLKSLVATEDEKSIDQIVENLRQTEGFELPDGMVGVLKSNARLLRQGREFSEEMARTQQEFQQWAQRQSIGLQHSGLQLDRAKFGEEKRMNDFKIALAGPIDPTGGQGIKFSTATARPRWAATPQISSAWDAMSKTGEAYWDAWRAEQELIKSMEEGVRPGQRKAIQDATAKREALGRTLAEQRRQFELVVPETEWQNYVKSMRQMALEELKMYQGRPDMQNSIRRLFYQRVGEKL